jgi:hypothetical protein
VILMALINLAKSRLKFGTLWDGLSGRGRERARSVSWAEMAAGYLDPLNEPADQPWTPRVVEPSLHSVAVIVATRGRPQIASRTVRHLLATQTLQPALTIVSCVDVRDAGDLVGLNGVMIVTGPVGSATQRNTALANIPAGTDIVAFFDDDFVADKDWLRVAVGIFRDEADVAGFTGRVLADGIKGPGISFEDATQIIETADPRTDWTCIEPYSPYGCNMAFRATCIGDLRFDDRLVLYGWLEDKDFAAALARRGGRFVKCAGARGVHMGVKGGRVSGDKVGYSQVVNPIYMWRKGTMTVAQMANHLFRNLASNIVRSAMPEPFIDRRGRLRGNFLGLADVLCGRIEPERAAAIVDVPGRGVGRVSRPVGRAVPVHSVVQSTGWPPSVLEVALGYEDQCKPEGPDDN